MNLDPEIGSSELDRRMMAALDKQLTQARATNARMHRRCQQAEAAALQNLEACREAGITYTRSLAIWTAIRYQRKAAEAQARAHAWKKLAKRQRRAARAAELSALCKLGRANDAAHLATHRAQDAESSLTQASAHVTDLQTRGTELVLENRSLRDRMTAAGPRRELWVSCGVCKARAPHPSGIKHKTGCGPVKSSGNGATPTSSTTTKGD